MNPEFVVITSFFNPAKYNSRIQNYKKFRANLLAYLVTVELSDDGNFYLSEADADVLIQVKSSSKLWQKERLLNIAIEQLSATVKYVAWVDADIIFGDPNWIFKSIKLLDKFSLVQPFKTLYDLGRGQNVSDCIKGSPSGYSFCYHHKNKFGINPKDVIPGSNIAFRTILCGLAWVARLELIKKHGFFDTMIIGSGDRMLAFAAVNKFEEAIHTTQLSKKRIINYMDWALPFYSSVKGNVGYLEGDIYHLWHGDLINRGWVDRHQKINQYNYDPTNDIVRNEFDCWEWNTDNEVLVEYIREYFESRKED